MTLAGLVQRWRRWRLASNGLQLDGSCQVGAGVGVHASSRAGTTGTIRARSSCRLEAGVQLDAWGGRIELGHRVFIGPYTVIYGHGGVEIGDDVLISMHCRVLSSNHSIPVPGTLIRSQADELLPTSIGKDVWLGAGVTVLGGVSIGEGCVVGAGAVVSQSLPAGSIAIGVPARIVGSRAARAPS